MNRPRGHHTKGGLLTTLCSLLDCAAKLTALRAGLILLAGVASCTLESSPVGNRVPEAKGASWQPSPAERRSEERDRGDGDASLPIERGPSSRPRSVLDAGKQATSSQSDGGDLANQHDGAVSVPVRPEAREAPKDAAVMMALSDAALPTPSAGDASTSSVDADVSVDASTASVTSSPDCRPGVYEGDFDGTLQAGEIPVSAVAGPITARLTLDASGSYLNIDDLRVVGRDVAGNILRATVTGKVNCKTLEIEEGQLVNGRYRVASRRGASFSFEGVVQGSYTSAPHALSGTWSVSAQFAELLTGDGVFSLVLND